MKIERKLWSMKRAITIKQNDIQKTTTSTNRHSKYEINRTLQNILMKWKNKYTKN